jgi:hypothetical protein
VIDQVKAPDGYELRTRNSHGPGLIGDLFGMRRYDGNVVLSKNGRVVPLRMPAAYRFTDTVSVVGWLENEDRR